MKIILLIFTILIYVYSQIPGPCKHSVLSTHIDTVNLLSKNQLKDGCFMNYTVVVKGNMTDVCFVKAALPWILELLTDKFKYDPSSVNQGYVNKIKDSISHLYAEKCVAHHDENTDDVVTETHIGSPQEALCFVSTVLSMYMNNIQTSTVSLNWAC